MKNVMSIFLILAISFSVYINSLENGFVWDDKVLILDNYFIKDITHLKEIFTKHLFYFTFRPSDYYRPLQTLSYLVDYSFWKLNPFGYHLTNIILHSLNAILVFLLINMLFNDNVISFIAGVFFTVHPLNTAAVTYISGRAELLMALFMLLSLLFFLKFIRIGAKGYYLSSLFCFSLALLSKESALIFPFFLILTGWMFSRISLRDIRLYLPFFIIAVIYTILRTTFLNFSGNLLQYFKGEIYSRILSIPVVILTYIRLIFLPIGLHMERAVPIVKSLFEPNVLFSLISVISILVFLIISFRYFKIITFGLLWFILGLIPVFFILYKEKDYYCLGLVRIAEHWIYLSLIGFALILASFIKNITKKRIIFNWVATTLFGLLIFFYSFQTTKRNRDWKDDFTIINNTLKYATYSATAYGYLGTIYLAEKKLDLAIKTFEDTLKISSLDQQEMLHNNLSLAYILKGDFKKAEEEFREALKINPSSCIIHANLGYLYYLNKDKENAKKEFRVAIELEPDYRIAYYRLVHIIKDEPALQRYYALLEKEPNNFMWYRNLGIIYIQEYLYPQALDNLKKALKLNPYDAKSYNALGVAYAKLKQFDKAIMNIRISLRLDPKDKDAYLNLGNVLGNIGKFKDAVVSWQEALKLDPNYTQAKENIQKVKTFLKK